MAQTDALSLDSDTYDVVILGTGLSEAILSGYAKEDFRQYQNMYPKNLISTFQSFTRALSRIGKRVLHLDGNEYYGGAYASFSLQSFKSFIELAQNPPQPTSTGSSRCFSFLSLKVSPFLLFYVIFEYEIIGQYYSHGYFRFVSAV